MPLFGSGFEAQKKLKPNLKMASQRMAMVINKKTNQVARHKRGIIDLLKAGKTDKANIKIEHIIREDRTIEAYEIISLMCELLVERLNLIAADKVCPADLVASIHTVIWAGPRLEAPELKVVTQQFGCKYGKEFVRRARQNADGMVNDKIISRLSIQPPTREQREHYMKELCGLAGIEFDESMIAGSTLAGVFDEDNRVGSKAAEIPELPTFPSYQGGGGAPGAGGAGGFPAGGGGGYPGPRGGFEAPRNAMAPGGYPGPGAPGGYPGPGGYGGPARGPPGGMAAGPAPGVYRVGDPVTGQTTSWKNGGGGAPAGAMAAAPAPVPSFPMPPSAGGAAEYGRAAFSAAMASPGTGAGAGAPPAGLNPSSVPPYNPPPPASKPAGGAGGGVAPSRNPAPSAVPDFDELSARFAALRDA